MQPRFGSDPRRWLWRVPCFRALSTDAQLVLLLVCWGPNSIADAGSYSCTIADAARVLDWPRRKVATAVAELLSAGFVEPLLGDEADLATEIADA